MYHIKIKKSQRRNIDQFGRVDQCETKAYNSFRAVAEVGLADLDLSDRSENVRELAGTVVLSKKLKKIGDWEFNYSPSLSFLDTPDSNVTKASKCAFSSGDLLSSINLPGGVIKVNCFAF